MARGLKRIRLEEAPKQADVESAESFEAMTPDDVQLLKSSGDGMSHKQFLFVQYFLGECRGNASAAAKMAGYGSGSRKAEQFHGSQCLNSTAVQRAIERHIARKFGSNEDIKNSIAAIAMGNANDYLEEDKNGELHISLKKLKQAGQMGLLHEVKEKILMKGKKSTILQRTLKMYDKLKALELLARLSGMLIDRTRHEGEVKVKFNPITLDGDKMVSDDEAITRN